MKLDELFQRLQEGYGDPYSISVRSTGSKSAISFHMSDIEFPNDTTQKMYYELFDKYSKLCGHLPKEERGNDPIFQKLKELDRENPNLDAEMKQIAEIFVTLLHAKLHECMQSKKENMDAISQAIDQRMAQTQSQGQVQ